MKKEQAIAKRELKIVQEKEKLTKEIEVISLWMNKGDVESGLQSLKQRNEKI